MLETPCPKRAVVSYATNMIYNNIKVLEMITGENAIGADNQQERLQPISSELGYYLSGFARMVRVVSIYQ